MEVTSVKNSLMAMHVLWAMFAIATHADVSRPKEKPPPQVDAAPTVTEGFYILRGSERNDGGTEGGSYSGMVTIVKKNQTYVLAYQIGLTSYMGVGVMEESKFVVGWHYPKAQGVTIYTVGDGKLSGKWTAFPSGSGREELTFKEPLER